MIQRFTLTAIVAVLLMAASLAGAQPGRLRIRVTDPTGAAVPTAYVSLLGADYHPVRSIQANNEGETIWTGLPPGNYRFRVDVLGFQFRLLTVTIRGCEETKAEAQLELGYTGMFDPVAQEVVVN